MRGTDETAPEYLEHYRRLLALAERRQAGGIIEFPARRPVGRPIKEDMPTPAPDGAILAYPRGSIGWVIDRFLDSDAAFHKKYRASTQESHRGALHVVRETLGPALVRDLNRRNVNRFCLQIAEKHGTARADHVRRVISLLWKFALGLPDAKIDEDRANPGHGERLHRVRHPHLPWPPHVQRKFLDGASDRLQLAYGLARYTGFRRGDICSITWAAYDEKEAKLYLKATEKTREYVPMHVEPELAELLAKTRRVHECILTNTRGQPYTKRALTWLFTERLRKIGARVRCTVCARRSLWGCRVHLKNVGGLLHCEIPIRRMADVGQTLPSRDFCGTAALPLKPDIIWRSWDGRRVPQADVSNRRKAALIRSPRRRGRAAWQARRGRSLWQS
jgi:integrase